MSTLNFSDKMSNIRAKINYWKRRSLTPLGKITIIKSFLLSSLNHVFISLPTPNEKMMKGINDLFYDFIWEGTSRIKKTTICQDYCDGGLKMIDLNAFVSALKSTWLRKLVLDSNNQWSILLQYSVNMQNILNLGTSYITEKILPKMKNMFWADLLLSHIQINKIITSAEVEKFLAAPIFYNDNLKIGNKTIYNKSCIENGIKYINDITKENGSLYTFDKLTITMYYVNINFLKYSGIVKSILDWKKKNKSWST